MKHRPTMIHVLSSHARSNVLYEALLHIGASVSTSDSIELGPTHTTPASVDPSVPSRNTRIDLSSSADSAFPWERLPPELQQMVLKRVLCSDTSSIKQITNIFGAEICSLPLQQTLDRVDKDVAEAPEKRNALHGKKMATLENLVEAMLGELFGPSTAYLVADQHLQGLQVEQAFVRAASEWLQTKVK